ncbi:MAG: nucleotidyltransferase domain-containing protein [Deltaproteobacteria bacterium]|nr:nucleotidyltransferase domain-containing protein [Deltaproteobacteria bacterium]MBW1995276.1 nucleotidyltransferase domain-containing protein [Deltaproteobacteria bacterium]MBW2153969.1 nucleotidyltransferase domain-containing protein [Deltaproteobacteria bacterium]
MVDRSVVKKVRNYLQNVNNEGIPVSFGIIFGSQIKGISDRWSDIDLLVVSPHFDKPRDRRDVDLLWRLAANTDSRIEPIPCGEQQWHNDVSSAIIEIARREGETISLSEEGW